MCGIALILSSIHINCSSLCFDSTCLACHTKKVSSHKPKFSFGTNYYTPLMQWCKFVSLKLMIQISFCTYPKKYNKL